MIKVCHIVNLLTGKADGVYAHLKMILRYSDRSKFQHFLIFQGGEKIEKELTEIGIKVFVSESLKKKISLKTFYDIYKFIKENDINIIHTHLIKPYAIAGLVNIFLHKKFIFNYHGLFIYNNPYYTFLEKIIYGSIHFIINILKVVDVVLVPSKGSKELLLKETRLFPDPVVYYNGYSFNKSHSEPDGNIVKQIEELRKSKLIISVIGRLEVDKRIDNAIRIIKNLIHGNENIHLLVFGDGRLRNEFQGMVNNEGLINYVSFMGYVEGMNSYYKYFDIVLFTSEWEGMPLTMWEALANKVPVVAPEVGGFKEILGENNCGLIYSPGNLNEAKEKLLTLISNASLRKELGESGYKTVTLKFNSRNFIQQTEEIYLNLAK